MMEKVKVNIITGFLGSGKTTAIINLLKQKDEKEEWAVIVNEYGEISIDTLTLSESTDSGRVYEIFGGCICCSAKEYFEENLNKIIDEGKYDRIIIEPTGLGGPEMIASVLQNSKLDVMPTICLVDTASYGDKRLQLLPLYRIQIQKADSVVLSKCDLLKDTKEIKSKLEQVEIDFPGKLNYIASMNGKIGEGLLDGEKLKQADFIAGMYSLPEKEIKGKSFKVQADKSFDLGQLIEFIKGQQEIIRAKGFFSTGDGWKLINYSLSGIHVEDSKALSENLITVFAETDEQSYFNFIESEIKNCIL